MSSLNRYSYDDFNDGKEYLRSSIVPPHPNFAGRERFKKKYNLFKLNDGKVYTIATPTRELIPPWRIDEILLEEYKNPATRITGVMRLWQTLKYKYVGISRTNVADFLGRIQSLQLRHQRIKSPVDRPVMPSATYPGQRLQIDHIEIAAKSLRTGQIRSYPGNNGAKYALNVIDVFSRFAWSFPVKRKDLGQTSMQGFINLVKSLIGTLRVIQGDRAFMGGYEEKDSAAWFFKEIRRINASIKNPKAHITLVTSSAYSPGSQGVIERFNGTLKEMIRKQWIATGNKEWATLLPNFVESYNNTYHTTIKARPIDVFENTNSTIEDKVRQNTKKAARKSVLKTRQLAPKVEVGYFVRLEVRFDPRKALTKKQGELWTKEIYKIVKVHKAKKYQNRLYEVVEWYDKHGNRSFDKTIEPRLYPASRMQIVEKPENIIDL